MAGFIGLSLAVQAADRARTIVRRAVHKAREVVARWLLVAGERLFRDEDALARRHGWHITIRSGGLSRTYRDPRFDQLASCPRCLGAGSDDHGEPCPHCLGQGRIRLGEPAGHRPMGA